MKHKSSTNIQKQNKNNMVRKGSIKKYWVKALNPEKKTKNIDDVI